MSHLGWREIREYEIILSEGVSIIQSEVWGEPGSKNVGAMTMIGEDYRWAREFYVNGSTGHLRTFWSVSEVNGRRE